MITAVKHEKVALKALESHLKTYYLQCLPIYQALTLSVDGNVMSVREGCQVFLYSEGIEIKGVIAFTGGGLCMVHFSDESAAKRYDVLKTVKDLKPEVLRGDPFSADLILKVLIRNLSTHLMDDYYIMFQEHSTASIEQFAQNPKYKIVEPAEIPFNTLVPFMIDMEKTFGRNPTSITLLKKKLTEKFENKTYLLAWDGLEVVGQGHVEYESDRHTIIGGIYTDRKHRNQGVGRTLTEALCQSVTQSNRQPALLVAMKNEAACHLYDRLGFVRVGIQRSYVLKY